METPTTMKAIRKVSAAAGPEATRLEEVPRPVPGKGEVLLQVLATAVCGTDKHIYNWDPGVSHNIQPPRTYGHEFCGLVAEPGPGVTGLAAGDYVSAEMHVVCGACRACRGGQRHACENTRILGLHGEGCFAGYVKVPAANVVRLPRSIPPRTGAFLDALGNAVHTTEYVRGLKGATVAVVGYGPIGAMCAAIAHHEGAERIFVLDVNPRSIDKAEAWKKAKGAQQVHILNSRLEADVIGRVRELNGGLVDAVFEMSGAERAVNQALALARFGGHVALLGIPRDPRLVIDQYSKDLIFKGLHVQAIIGRRMFETWERMLKLLSTGLDVSFVVTEEYPGLEHFHEGMAAFERGDALKVVFYPHGRVAAP